jgi:hypothetical protein
MDRLRRAYDPPTSRDHSLIPLDCFRCGWLLDESGHPAHQVRSRVSKDPGEYPWEHLIASLALLHLGTSVANSNTFRDLF